MNEDDEGRARGRRGLGHIEVECEVMGRVVDVLAAHERGGHRTRQPHRAQSVDSVNAGPQWAAPTAGGMECRAHVTLLGEFGVGKSSLAIRFVGQPWSDALVRLLIISFSATSHVDLLRGCFSKAMRVYTFDDEPLLIGDARKCHPYACAGSYH